MKAPKLPKLKPDECVKCEGSGYDPPLIGISTCSDCGGTGSKSRRILAADAALGDRAPDGSLIPGPGEAPGECCEAGLGDWRLRDIRPAPKPELAEEVLALLRAGGCNAGDAREVLALVACQIQAKEARAGL